MILILILNIVAAHTLAIDVIDLVARRRRSP
jgi:hypothetical protein